MARRNGRNGTLESLAKLDAWFNAAEAAEAAERRARRAPEDPIAADLVSGLKDAVLDELRRCHDPNALVSALAALRTS